MTTRMLIDARHPEETRVAVLSGNRIEEFDFESAEHKQIKGNIYLAKVTRVEPSLQAAFVDFGGNRHGFLAFGEIHPDYYQIPAADREALLAEEQAHAEEEAALRAEEEAENDFDGRDDETADDDGVLEMDTSLADDVSIIEDGQVEDDTDADGQDEPSADDGDEDEEGGNGNGRRRPFGGRGGRRQEEGCGGNGSSNRAKEMDELRAKRQAVRRRYKIQDVIQRRQVLLVQVVKEERSNKGAALTTYLSLAGRYCVLMPNSSQGGGISRKISGGEDRKRLKQIVGELSLPKSMGLIVRTAGLQRNKTEIKRDFDYLARLWDEIRETTLGSSAPAVIHSDSDLIKRAIRDIYNREIEEVVVEGEEGYRAARQFMKLLMPSHARRVKAYSDPVPMFQRYGAEDQLSAMYDPMVQLKSGGYLVINPTEALVSIDINSGRSTKEHGIEQTALSTNLEAAREIARQLRLRDMAGLVVIDFIDMENNSSIRKVEKAMKGALKNDRARIQIGRISGFGLMEMSRQRLRTGVLEATTRTCPHCDGTGLVRTASSAGLSALRLIEEEAARGKGIIITLFASSEAAIYLLNAKRGDLAEIEARYGVSVEVVPEGEDEGAKMRIQSSGPRPTEAPRFTPIVTQDEEDDDDLPEEDDEDETGDDDIETADEDADSDEGDANRQGRNRSRSADEDDDGARKKRRRRRRGGRGRNRGQDQEADGASDEDESTDGDGDDDGDTAGTVTQSSDDDSEGSRRPRRGRRRSRGSGSTQQDDTNTQSEAASGSSDEATDSEAAADDGEEAEKKPARRSRRRKPAEETVDEEADEAAPAEAKSPAKTPRKSRRKADTTPPADESEMDAVPSADGSSSEPSEEAEPATKARPRRAARSQRSTKAETTSEPVAEPETQDAEAPSTQLETVASDDRAIADAGSDGASGEAHDDDGSTTRRGWWQRTFGN